jgi:salicylate hydroxylase
LLIAFVIEGERNMSRSPKVTVIGAGIGGLTTVSALLARGIEATAYDQAEVLTEVGAGVQITPNGVKVVRDLGLEPQFLKFGFKPDAIVGRDWQSGKTVFRTPLGSVCERLYGAPYIQIHRADLQRLLRESVADSAVKLSSQCVEVRKERDSAVAKFADDREVESDLIVAADGVKSPIRQTLFGDSAPRFTGHICWRCLVPFESPNFDLVSPDTSIWFGPNGHVVTYYVKAGKSVNIAAILETGTWQEESWNVRSTKEELAAAYSGWHPKLQRLFAQAEEVYRWGLFVRDPMPSWTIGRITLLGDAAHPMLPYLSQGAAMAMEDGLVLARMLSKHKTSIAAALGGYETLRVPRATRVQLTSHEQGKKNHLVSPWARLRRDVVYRIRNLINPQKTGLSAGWVYAHDASCVDIADEILLNANLTANPASPHATRGPHPRRGAADHPQHP